MQSPDTPETPETTTTKRSLDIISVDEPCTVDWDTMLGSGAVRYCRLCKQNVYNLSDMSREEAEELVFASEGKLCVRYYRRADGTLMTQDCAPTRAARFRKASRRALKGVGAVLALGLGAVASFKMLASEGGRGKACANTVGDKWSLPFVEPDEPEVMMGEAMVEPPPVPIITQPPHVQQPPPAIQEVYPDPEIDVTPQAPPIRPQRMGRIRRR